MGRDFKNLTTWREAKELRRKIYVITQRFPKSEYRRVSQMRDCARSVKQNIQEGSQKTLGEYIHFLKNHSKPSLAELNGDVDDCFEDELIAQEEYNALNSHCKRLDYLLMKQIRGLQRIKKDDENK